MSEEIKFCRDCRFNRGSLISPISGEYDRCTRKSNLVARGGSIKEYSEIERKYSSIGCGKEAKYFEPKHPSWWQRLWGKK